MYKIAAYSMDISLSVAKSAVMNEVAKQTSYIGAKITTSDGSNAYEQIFTTNDDYSILERYWREAISAITVNLRKFIKTVSPVPSGSQIDPNEVFALTLSMPSRFDSNQTPSIQSALFSYFTNFITSKWLAVSYKPDAEYYERYAEESMKEIMIKIYYKKPATRSTP